MFGKTKKFFVLSIVISVLCSMFAGVSFAAPIVDYTSLFSQVEKVDGYKADELAVNLYKSYVSTPESFVKATASLTDNQAKNVAELLVYEASASSSEFSKFQNSVSKLKSSKKLTSKESRLIDYVLDGVTRTQSEIKNAGTLLKQDVPKAPEFDVETIKSFIKTNKNLGQPMDEEYCETIAKAFRTNNKLFAKVVSDFADSDISKISTQIAYDNKKKNMFASTVQVQSLSANTTSATPLNVRENLVLSNIINEISKAEKVVEIRGEATSVSTPKITVMAASNQVPTISSMTYTSGKLEVGTTETLKITLSESNYKTVSRQYLCDVYCSRNGTSWFKGSTYITIPSGATSAYGNVNYTFSSAGPVYTTVKVYTGYAGTLLTQRQGTYSDNVYGKWQIKVSLPSNRNYKGTLSLYDASGTLVSLCK